MSTIIFIVFYLLFPLLFFFLVIGMNWISGPAARRRRSYCGFRSYIAIYIYIYNEIKFMTFLFANSTTTHTVGAPSITALLLCSEVSTWDSEGGGTLCWCSSRLFAAELTTDPGSGKILIGRLTCGNPNPIEGSRCDTESKMKLSNENSERHFALITVWRLRRHSWHRGSLMAH